MPPTSPHAADDPCVADVQRATDYPLAADGPRVADGTFGFLNATRYFMREITFIKILSVFFHYHLFAHTLFHTKPNTTIKMLLEFFNLSLKITFSSL